VKFITSFQILKKLTHFPFLASIPKIPCFSKGWPTEPYIQHTDLLIKEI
jgi:hypothetical protein